MKALSFLAPILKFFKFFGFIYRIIGLVGCFIFFSSNIQDLMFTSSHAGAEAMSIEKLISLPKDEIPRYLKLDNLALLNDAYVVTQNEDTGAIMDASYPVYSLSQMAEMDSITGASEILAHVIVKDNDFNEDSLSILMNVNGLYEDESFEEVRDILTSSGVNVSPNAILIVKDEAPSFSSSLLWTFLTGLIGLLILLSFIPNSMLGVKEEVELNESTSNEEEIIENNDVSLKENNPENDPGQKDDSDFV